MEIWPLHLKDPDSGISIEVWKGFFMLNGNRFDRPFGIEPDALLGLCVPKNRCLCCMQTAQIHFNKMVKRSMLVGLVHLYHATLRTPAEDFIHIDEIVRSLDKKDDNAVRQDLSKLKHWNLLEKVRSSRRDGMPSRVGRTGLYKITKKGFDFVLKRDFIQEYTAVYNDQCLGTHGRILYIDDPSIKGFDWKAELNGVPCGGV